MNLPEQPVYVPVTLIRDGELLPEELAEIDKTKDWLLLQLQSHGIGDYKHVFLAEWLKGDGLFVQPFE